MADQKYYGIPTIAGEEEIAEAFVTGRQILITHLAAGDGAGTYYRPTAEMTALRREVWRAQVTSVTRHGNMVIAKAVVPNDVGGFTVRELAAYGESGKMLAVCNIPDTEKVTLGDGVNGELELAIHFIISHAEMISLVAGSMLYITREEFDGHNTDPDAHNGQFKLIRREMADYDDSMTRWQVRQDYRLDALELALNTGFAGTEVTHTFLPDQLGYWRGYDGTGYPEGVLDPATGRVTA